MKNQSNSQASTQKSDRAGKDLREAATNAQDGKNNQKGDARRDQEKARRNPTDGRHGNQEANAGKPVAGRDAEAPADRREPTDEIQGAKSKPEGRGTGRGTGRDASSSSASPDDAADNRNEPGSPAAVKDNKARQAPKQAPDSPEADDNGDVPAYGKTGRDAHGPDAQKQPGHKR